jgi:hypothetical protein
VQPLAARSSPDCSECQRIIGVIRQSYADGGSLRGGSYVIRLSVVSSLRLSDRPSLDVQFDRDPRSSIGSDGKVRGTLPGVSFVVCRVLLEWTRSGWRMVTLTATSPIA